MSSLPHAKSFRDLVVYQKAKALAKEIFQISKRFPREEIGRLLGGTIAKAEQFCASSSNVP